MTEDRGEVKGLDRLWARQVVTEGLAIQGRDADRGYDGGGIQMLGCKGCIMFDEGPSYRLTARLTQLALQYQVLTPLTSWVFVDPEAPETFDPTRQVTVHVPVARFHEEVESLKSMPDIALRMMAPPPSNVMGLMPPMAGYMAQDDSFGSSLSSLHGDGHLGFLRHEVVAPVPSRPSAARSRAASAFQHLLMSQQADGLWGDWTATLEALAAVLEAMHAGDRMAKGAVTKAFEAIVKRLTGGDGLGTTEELAIFAVLLGHASGRQAKAIAQAASSRLGTDDLPEITQRAAAELHVDLSTLRSPADLAAAFLPGVVQRLAKFQRLDFPGS